MRLSLVCSEVLVCEMLFASRIGDIQSLVGAVSGLLLTYVFPTIFYTALVPADSSWSLVFLQVNAALAAMLAVAGAVVAMQTIVTHASEYSFFHGPCESEIGEEDG